MAVEIRNVSTTGSRDTLKKINNEIQNMKNNLNELKDVFEVNDGNVHMTGHLGIKKESSPDYALDVDGTIRAQEVTAVSDNRLKTNIKPLGDVLTKINQLQAYSFFLKGDEKNQNKIGLIAQDLLPIFPEFVAQDEKGFYSINYANMTAVLLNACNQLTLQNQTFENRLKKVEEKLFEK